MEDRLLISFSGGRTSAYMLWWLCNEWEDRCKWEKIVVFANTGKEYGGTLVFVDEVSARWHIPIVWVEAKHLDSEGSRLSKRGWKVQHKCVNYVTASRNGEPYEEMISQLGIPTTNAPFCSDQLKRRVIESYMRSIGWQRYYKAVGIRCDEIDRINPKYKEKKIMYPLVNMIPTDKKMVNDFWAAQDFKLNVPAGLGNCDNCWKKDMKTLAKNAKNYPETLNWWQEMTDKYGNMNPRNTELKPPFNFYRGNKSPKDILELSNLKESQLNIFSKKEKLDGCSESCEVF